MTTAAADFTLPTELQTRHADLLEALNHPKDYDGEKWPQGTQFMDAYAPEAVAKILIGVLHDHLQGYRIAYIWREAMARNGAVVLGKAKRAAGELHYFSEFDFVLSFNWSTWGGLTPRQQVALVDHELEHCIVEVTDKGTKPALAPHDVEEFTEIIERWGLWRPSLEQFGAAVQKAAQLSLFPQ